MFDTDVIKELETPLSSADVQERKAPGGGNRKVKYVAGYHVIGEANRIFGFGNWDDEILTLTKADTDVYEKQNPQGGAPTEMVSVSYLCTLRVTVHDGDDRNRVSVHEDTGFGNGVASNTPVGRASCIELASKEAVTDALKRCMRKYGDKFGLALYDKEGEVLTPEELQDINIVTREQLAQLRELYEAREIDDTWVFNQMREAGFGGQSVNDMNRSWWQWAMKTVHEYKLQEIEDKEYAEYIADVLPKIEAAESMSILKGFFGESWKKASARKDNGAMDRLQKAYALRKSELEVEGEDK